jgi:hypothetical protein
MFLHDLEGPRGSPCVSDSAPKFLITIVEEIRSVPIHFVEDSSQLLWPIANSGTSEAEGVFHSAEAGDDGTP